MPNEFILKDSPYYQLYFADVHTEPFVKWVGGKRQIINEIHNFLPKTIEVEQNNIYIEPFVGGGAVFFSLYKSPNIEKFVLIDNNPILILTYKIIKKHVNKLIDYLYALEQKYKSLNTEEKQSDFYYDIRTEYNNLLHIVNDTEIGNELIKLSSNFIFLNRTCFNGLYRVNSKGEFNVPKGSYKNPNICNSENLYHVSKALERAEILHGDFEIAEQFINENTFFYLDPPYRPLNSSSFTSYTKIEFDDEEQKRLASFCDKIDKLGGKFLLSNSDPKNTDLKDNFFENLYSKFNIKRIHARRNINSNGNDRGLISELLIMNY